ncbi:replicative DNA helicase [Desnuesiella massiliensis]|uniref:replicative DNA helicase n=1 Tax=Desnuesiella massiliensis TaxID=1650662 RepID=UPI000B09BD97|nr:replicative DNA helicase [Desnuesiella massiliensis]
MGANINSITENYRERIQRLALFDTLYKLENKNTKDNSNNPIDFFGLGLLTLLFFFENMLIRNKKTGVRELAQFLFDMNKGEIDLDYVGFEKVARTIVEAFRPPTGKRNAKTFYNWETRQMESVQYSILKTDKADLITNTQYYILDEQGLELIFATKEYFNEFQLSINQLVLRKQLEKGEFSSALRQIDEMRLDVQNLQDRMIRIKHEVTRNIVSNETYERYKNIIEDVNMRLQRENEEFDELQAFVKETKEKIGNELLDDKDRKTYELIVEIDRELDEVHYEHRLLLKDSIVLKTTALQSAQEALYYIGIDSFNFNQEITSRLFASPLPLNAARRLIEPFLYLERFKAWSPITVFSEQRIESGDKQENSKDFLGISEDEEIKLEISIQGENYKKIAELLLIAMKENKEITLKEFVGFIKENGQQRYLDHRTFYDFWILLHQKSPIAIEEYEKDEELLLSKALRLFINRGSIICVEETEDILKVTDRFTIKNMRLRLEAKQNGL